MGQFRMNDLTDAQRAQLALDVTLLEQDIVIISQLQVINVQHLRDSDGLAVRSNLTSMCYHMEVDKLVV